MKKTPKRRRTVRVPRPVLAMAAPISEHPVVTIDRLRSGEYNFSVRVPGRTLALARERAYEEAKHLMFQCLDLETLEKMTRKSYAALEAERKNGKAEVAEASASLRKVIALADQDRLDAIEQAKTLHEISRGFQP